MTNFSQVKAHIFFDLKKIKRLIHLRWAIKHNKREIANELRIGGHINSARTHLNYSLHGSNNSADLMMEVNRGITAYRKRVGKAIRHDAVVAIEVLFSVSATKQDIDLGKYFEDCLSWSTSEFAPAVKLSADVHLDESNPHMHIIFLCVTESKLVASQVSGNKVKFRNRRENFYFQVAKNYGFELSPPALNRIHRIWLAQKVIAEFNRSHDPITLSQHYQAVCEAVKKNPMPFAKKLEFKMPWHTHQDADTRPNTHQKR
jgi:Plasmid recombination enzyme